MTAHAMDQALALEPLGGNRFLGRTHPAYANMVGPFGGVTAAQALQSVLLHPQRLGEPVALTVNFCVGVADGAFTLVATPVRTNRSTQHWTLLMEQEGQVVFTGTAVTAVRRKTWGLDDEPMPTVPPPQAVPVLRRTAPMAFVRCYEQRPVDGALPSVWDGREGSGVSRLWVRDHPARALDFPALAALSDIFFPRVFVRRAKHVPAGTVTLSTYFHVGGTEIGAVGDGHLLGQAKAHAYRNGFFDQTAQLWNQAGTLLVSTHQLVYYKE
ncbi:MAG: acyl-CoA thioesterase [Rhodoferax sp.]